MQTVELHQAFVWSCESCGRDNFARSIVLDDQHMQELASRPGNESVASAMEFVLDVDDSFDAMGGHWCTAPTRVTCGHCGETFKTEEP